MSMSLDVAKYRVLEASNGAALPQVVADNPHRADDHRPDGVETVGYLVRDVHRAFTRALQERIAAHGVSMGQWFFLRALWEEDGLTQSELSQRVGMMEPTTVTALNSMERRSLVQRVRNTHDRRKVNIFLTSKGKALRDVLLPAAEEVNVDAVRGLTAADVKVAIAVLRAMTNTLGSNGHSFVAEDEDDPRH